MPMLAETIDAVVGGDTHRDRHALEIASPTGTPIATLEIDNDDLGFSQALAWIVTHAPGPNIVVALEGTRSYGIGLARALQAAGLTVIEVARPRREERRRGKSDPIDAHLAVLHALRMPADRLPSPRADGDREALRILLAARRDLTRTKTANVNRLRALLLGGDDSDRALARNTLSEGRLALIARRRGRPGDTLEQQIRRGEAQRLARAIREATSILAQNKKQLAAIVTALAPALLDATGVGPVSAAQALVSWSHPGRCRNDAAFAALAGACPIPASSGRIVRHRLNRGGDRQLNRALHDILLTRWRICPRTHAYIARRRAEGKTDREIRRCLKRHIARQLFRTMQATALDAT
jgi:transposase